MSYWTMDIPWRAFKRAVIPAVKEPAGLSPDDGKQQIQHSTPLNAGQPTAAAESLSIQGDHLAAVSGNVREFDSYHDNVMMENMLTAKAVYCYLHIWSNGNI